MRPEWANAQPEAVSRLLVALDAAARWCDDTKNHSALAETLADPKYIAAPEEIIRQVLAGRFSVDAQGNQRVIERYFTFHENFANYPRKSQALWIYSQMIRWGQANFTQQAARAAASAYRSDLYRNALGAENTPPEADMRIEGDTDGDRFMDGHIFDPSEIEDYVKGFPVSAGHPGAANSDET
jgi:NitT/TauT family transport system ATP-binding protein